MCWSRARRPGAPLHYNDPGAPFSEGASFSRGGPSRPALQNFLERKVQNQKGCITKKKTFKLIDLDCANCAAKMENAIKKIDGVADASVSFMAQKMTVEADDARFDDIMKQIVKACKKVEPDCEIVL